MCTYDAQKSNVIKYNSDKKFKPKDKVYSLNDGNGLILRAKITGIYTWIYNYYHLDTKKRNNLVIGDFPKYSLEDARDKARDYKELVRMGIDPKAKRDRDLTHNLENERKTFKDAANGYFA